MVLNLKLTGAANTAPQLFLGLQENVHAHIRLRYAAVHKLYIRFAYISTWNTIQDPGRPALHIPHAIILILVMCCPLCLQLAIDVKHSDHVASVVTIDTEFLSPHSGIAAAVKFAIKISESGAAY